MFVFVREKFENIVKQSHSSIEGCDNKDLSPHLYNSELCLLKLLRMRRNMDPLFTVQLFNKHTLLFPLTFDLKNRLQLLIFLNLKLVSSWSLVIFIL